MLQGFRLGIGNHGNRIRLEQYFYAYYRRNETKLLEYGRKYRQTRNEIRL